MNRKNIMERIQITAIVLLSALILSACGANSPAGSSNNSVTTGAPTTITMTVVFPPRNGPSGYINPLISASTDLINLSVYQAGTFTALGSVTIYPPASGGVASATVTLPKYAAGTNVDVQIMGYSYALGNYNSKVWKTNIPLTAGTNTNLSIAQVEVKQGVAAISAVSLTAPDGTNYSLNDIFLDYEQFGNFYQMGIKATNGASTGYHYSTSNIYASTSVVYNGAAGLSPDVRDGQITFAVEVPDASTSIWNQYNIHLDFAPGGVPSNTPTITGTFIGTFTASAGVAFPASGTAGTGFNIPAASWSNNIAPTVGIPILF